MLHPQTLRIPFQEFGFFTQLSQESSPQTSPHTRILEESLLISCKSHKKNRTFAAKTKTYYNESETICQMGRRKDATH